MEEEADLLEGGGQAKEKKREEEKKERKIPFESDVLRVQKGLDLLLGLFCVSHLGIVDLLGLLCTGAGWGLRENSKSNIHTRHCDRGKREERRNKEK